jgi:hypothetical protein
MFVVSFSHGYSESGRGLIDCRPIDGILSADYDFTLRIGRTDIRRYSRLASLSTIAA